MPASWTLPVVAAVVVLGLAAGVALYRASSAPASLLEALLRQYEESARGSGRDLTAIADRYRIAWSRAGCPRRDEPAHVEIAQQLVAAWEEQVDGLSGPGCEAIGARVSEGLDLWPILERPGLPLAQQHAFWCRMARLAAAAVSCEKSDHLARLWRLLDSFAKSVPDAWTAGWVRASWHAARREEPREIENLAAACDLLDRSYRLARGVSGPDAAAWFDVKRRLFDRLAAGGRRDRAADVRASTVAMACLSAAFQARRLRPEWVGEAMVETALDRFRRGVDSLASRATTKAESLVFGTVRTNLLGESLERSLQQGMQLAVADIAERDRKAFHDARARLATARPGPESTGFAEMDRTARSLLSDLRALGWVLGRCDAPVEPRVRYSERAARLLRWCYSLEVLSRQDVERELAAVEDWLGPENLALACLRIQIVGLMTGVIGRGREEIDRGIAPVDAALRNELDALERRLATGRQGRDTADLKAIVQVVCDVAQRYRFEKIHRLAVIGLVSRAARLVDSVGAGAGLRTEAAALAELGRVLGEKDGASVPEAPGGPGRK